MYLKIENPGVAPVEGFTLLGATSKRVGVYANKNLIGQFGSGNKHAAAVLLRRELAPTVFCGNHKLEFGTKQGTMRALEGDTLYSRMVVKHGGKDEDGKSVTYNEDLSQTDDYGVLDWTDLGMALREFVSNAIDGAITYNAMNGVDTIYPWDGVVVTIVEDNQVRAKSGYTRVFVPATDEALLHFVTNLGKWFLHFSEPETIYWVNTTPPAILEKRNRNFGDTHTSVIYRRGVRVREISGFMPSLFDYNLNDLRMDESRNVDDYVCAAACAGVVSGADVGSLTKLLTSFMGSVVYWEHGFSQYDLRPQWGEGSESIATKEKAWGQALDNLAANAVLIQSDAPTDTLVHKGYQPIKVPEAYVRIGETFKIRTPSKVLSDDERTGRQIIPANDAAIKAVNWCWERIVLAGMDQGKTIPPVHCFRSLMDGGAVVNGFYREGEVYINENISQGESVKLRDCALEELAHYITGSGDFSRDIQQWAFEFGVRSLMVRDGELPPGA